MKTLLTIASVVLAAAAFAGPNGNCSPKPPRGMRPDRPGDPIVRMVTNKKVAEKIGLTEEQKAKIEEINKALRDNAEELHKKVCEAMERQAELLKADKVDEAAVMAEIDKAFEVRKELAKRQTKRIIDIKALLTPEQVKKALEAFKDRPQGARKARRDDGNGHKGRRGDRPHKGPKPEGGDKPEPNDD